MMGVIARLTGRAFMKGRRAAEFRHAADRHAKAAWLWIIGAGVVWYFFNGIAAAVLTAACVWSSVNSVVSTLVADRLVSVYGDSEADTNE